MAKRFTDSDKWKRPWFAELSLHAKLTWVYLLDDCDHRGVWVANFKRASFDLGFKLSAEKILGWFQGKVIKIEKDKYFVPSFIDFQYSSGLNENNNAHKPIISLLKKYEDKLGAHEGLGSPLEGAQDKEKDKELDKDKELLGECEGKNVAALDELGQIVAFWNAQDFGLPKVKELTADRRKKLKLRLSEAPIGVWFETIERIGKSDFLLGKKGDWKASFDWLIRGAENRLKILEGQYENHASPSKGLDIDSIELPRRGA